MPYTTADARQQLLDTLADATEQLGSAVAALSEAYEALDEGTGERLEHVLFRPVQAAYGRAQRTHADFAGRHGLPEREFTPAIAGAPSRGVKGFLDDAVQAVANADTTLATLQDSMLPVEVGDPQLRAGLEDVRSRIGDVGGNARELVRTIGR
ncbi:MAG: hypothetical protein JWO23_1680 [Solirubrobacterales bacterium]|nr:hypothetical protein [Solirubrobacterales bacterium]